MTMRIIVFFDHQGRVLSFKQLLRLDLTWFVMHLTVNSPPPPLQPFINIRSLNCFYPISLYSLQNPVARWHICQGSINGMAFSADGAYIATVGRDGIVIVPHPFSI